MLKHEHIRIHIHIFEKVTQNALWNFARQFIVDNISRIVVSSILTYL